MKDFISRFTSRKFLLAVLGILIVFGVPLTTEQTTAITVLIAAFTVAEGASDYARANK